MWGDYERVIWALCVWTEARGTSLEAKIGVARTIWNRALDPQKRWPRSVSEVCFSLRNEPITLPSPKDFAFSDCHAAIEAAGRLIDDPTKGATHFHRAEAGEPWPYWAEDRYRTTQIGPFHFYKL